VSVGVVGGPSRSSSHSRPRTYPHLYVRSEVSIYRREREWLVSSGNLFNMPGNWTDRNVYAFLGPGYLFGYLVKKMLTMRDYVREMLRVLAEQTPPQLSLTQGANGWTLSGGDRGHYLGAYGGPRLRRPERFYEPTGSHDPKPLWKTHF